MNELLLKVYAQTATTTPIEPGTDISNWNDLVIFITNLIIIVGAGLVVIMLAMGFVRYITSQGDKTAVDTAQKWLTYAALGGIGLFFVYIIRTIIFSLVGITATELTQSNS